MSSTNKPSKMTRQLKIYYRLTFSQIIGPADIMLEFNITRRMLQRDLKDFKDSGLLNTKPDRKNNNYIKSDDAVFDESAPKRRKSHLVRLYRIGTLIHELSKTGKEDLHMYGSALDDYVFEIQLSKQNPTEYPPEEISDKPEPFDFPNIKAEYYALFPDSNERTRQRDFEELNRAGFKLYYDRKYKTFIFEYDENTGELMDIWS